jgi:hypothetical protein
MSELSTDIIAPQPRVPHTVVDSYWAELPEYDEPVMVFELMYENGDFRRQIIHNWFKPEVITQEQGGVE